ncbi:helix-turn-helix domain-containing protein [Corynebacterium accolens]|uniref:helix-turn-helix domain-containing protein n=1 Tax=Corynebacterium accolens TaxID=38284 RepID=UPI00345E0F46
MSAGPRKSPDKVSLEVASLLREHMARRRMSQRHAARLTDISPSQISRYLRGDSSPNLHEYVIICDAIGVHPDTLLAQALHNIRWREQYAKDNEHAVPVEGQVRYNLDPRNFPPQEA